MFVLNVQKHLFQGKIINVYSSLLLHVKLKYKCTSNLFFCRFHLSEHMNIHKGVRPYSCTECGKNFYKHQHLQQHCQIHVADTQKVTCEVCGKKFCRKSNLLKHIRQHNQDRKYKCCVCGVEFALLNTMLSHRKMHEKQDIQQKFEKVNNTEVITLTFFYSIYYWNLQELTYFFLFLECFLKSSILPSSAHGTIVCTGEGSTDDLRKHSKNRKKYISSCKLDKKTYNLISRTSKKYSKNV